MRIAELIIGRPKAGPGGSHQEGYGLTTSGVLDNER